MCCLPGRNSVFIHIPVNAVLSLSCNSNLSVVRVSLFHNASCSTPPSLYIHNTSSSHGVIYIYMYAGIGRVNESHTFNKMFLVTSIPDVKG